MRKQKIEEEIKETLGSFKDFQLKHSFTKAASQSDIFLTWSNKRQKALNIV